LEVGASAADLVDDVLQADDLPADVLLHLRVGFHVDPLLAHLAVELLVDQLGNEGLGGLAPGDVVLDPLEETDVGGGALEEDGSVDLPEVELAQDALLGLRDVGDSPDPDHEQQFADPVDIVLLLDGQLLVAAVLRVLMLTLSL
jgi:hypothetical protein